MKCHRGTRRRRPGGAWDGAPGELTLPIIAERVALGVPGQGAEIGPAERPPRQLGVSATEVRRTRVPRELITSVAG